MAIFFWLFLVPLVVLMAVVWALAKASRFDQPLDTLPLWRQLLRTWFAPLHDLTPEQRAEAIAEMRHREIVRAIRSSRR